MGVGSWVRWFSIRRTVVQARCSPARLKATFPTLGSQRIANMLARAGLHVARTTVRRFLKQQDRAPAPAPTDATSVQPGLAATPRIISRGPNHTWLVDLTVMPTSAGFWVPWLPFALVQRWPFCWWIAVVIDHFSRAVVGRAVFKQQPSANEVLGVLDGAVRRAGRAPKYILTDQGAQFQGEYLAWCARRGEKLRTKKGAVVRLCVGQHAGRSHLPVIRLCAAA